MAAPGELVLAAVSGGVDSMVMLHVLCSLCGELGVRVAVCHVDHGLRGERSRRDAAFVRETAARLGLPFRETALDGEALKREGGSVQAAARKARYAFFREAAAELGAGRIATGHTADDQAETVLMRFLKGSGPRGLGGIPPVRGPFIRPLIEVGRDDVLAYARAAGVEWVEDDSNRDTRYLRNRLRLEVVPWLERRCNPALRRALVRTARLLRCDEEFLGAAAAALFSEALIERGGDAVVLDRAVIIGAHRSLSLRSLISAVGLVDPDVTLCSAHLEALASLVAGPAPNARLDLPGGLEARREYERLVVGRRRPPGGGAAAREIELDVPGDTFIEWARCAVEAGVVDASLNGAPPVEGIDPLTAYFDLDALRLPLVCRTRRSGDRLRPFGMEGRKKLKDLFMDRKVPGRLRDKALVIASADEIIWVAGLARSAAAPVTRATERILRLTCRNAEGPLAEIKDLE